MSYWGVNYFLREIVRLPRFASWAKPLADSYSRAGIWIAILVAALLAIVARGQRASLLMTAALTVAGFLIFTPGIGVELVIVASVLLIFIDPGIALIVGICVALAALFSFLLPGVDDPAPGPIFAIFAWAALIAFVWKNLRFKLRPFSPPIWLGLIAVGFIAREIIAAVSIGSGDAHILQYIARSIESDGLLALYRRDASVTNTPLTAYCCLVCDVISRLTCLPFPVVLKQLTIGCDVIVCVLLFKIARSRSNNRAVGLATAAAYVWCPLAILASAYHGNFDPLYAMLALLAAYAIDRRGAWFVGGIFLGAAIDVKLIPILLVPMLLAVCPDRRRLARFLAGLAVMSIQYFVLCFIPRETYLHNIIRYQSQIDKWGLMFILSEASRQPRFSAAMQTMMYAFFDRGRFVLLLAIALAAIRARRIHLTALQTAACGAAIFFILTPGFAIQYLIFVVPLLFATRPVSAIVFGITAGLIALFFYWLNWTGGLPFDSTGIGTTPRTPGPQFGLLAWATLVAFVWTTLELKLFAHVPRFFSVSRDPARS